MLIHRSERINIQNIKNNNITSNSTFNKIYKAIYKAFLSNKGYKAYIICSISISICSTSTYCHKHNKV